MTPAAAPRPPPTTRAPAGRDKATGDLYHKAMKQRVPFQFYKDWILRELSKPEKVRRGASNVKVSWWPRCAME